MQNFFVHMNRLVNGRNEIGTLSVKRKSQWKLTSQLCYHNIFEIVQVNFVVGIWCHIQCLFIFCKTYFYPKCLKSYVRCFLKDYIIKIFVNKHSSTPGQQGCWYVFKIIPRYIWHTYFRIWIDNSCFCYTSKWKSSSWKRWLSRFSQLDLMLLILWKTEKFCSMSFLVIHHSMKYF